MDQLLKVGHARSVVVRGDAVVKRFRHPSRLARLLDGRRARREFELLRLLGERGLAVPRPRRLARVDGAWEVSMERIPGESVETLLETPAGRERLDRAAARAVGELLADAGRAGLDHPDLHPGNVLVGEGGVAHLVDLHGARLARPRRERLERDLLALYAPLREVLEPGARVALVEAWGERLGVPPEAVAQRVVELEERSPAFRRRRVEAGLGRWTRPSGRVQRAELQGRAVLQRRGAPSPADLARSPGARLEVRGAEPAVAAAWLSAARAFEHRLPVGPPAVLRLDGPASFAWFEPPPGACSLAPREPDPLAALLADRALAGRDVPAARLLDAAGRAWLAPVT